MIRVRPWAAGGRRSGRRRPAQPAMEPLEGRDCCRRPSTPSRFRAMLRRSSLGRMGTSGPPRSAWPGAPTGSRISTSGGLTEFPVAANSGAGSAGPGGTGLAVGSDGDIWFILANSADIGRITPSGSVSYVSPGASDFPTAIAEGPDGNIWVAEYNSQPSVGQQNEIARVTPESTVTQFVVPNAPGYAGGPVIAALASGPGGELWFGSTAGYLGHMTTSGTVGYLPLSAIAPYGIASEVDSFVAGPAGDLWFLASIATSGGTDAVGHLAADGSITAFPTQIDPGTMTIGPDGNLWITQRTGFMAAYVEQRHAGRLVQQGHHPTPPQHPEGRGAHDARHRDRLGRGPVDHRGAGRAWPRERLRL